MNRALNIVDSIKRKLGGLAADEGGVSAVEFAMLLPLMLSLYLGSPRSRRASAPTAR